MYALFVFFCYCCAMLICAILFTTCFCLWYLIILFMMTIMFVQAKRFFTLIYLTLIITLQLKHEQWFKKKLPCLILINKISFLHSFLLMLSLTYTPWIGNSQPSKSTELLWALPKCKITSEVLSFECIRHFVSLCFKMTILSTSIVQ